MSIALTVAILTGTSAFGWTPEILTRNTTMFPDDVALGDLDGDGDLDVVSIDGHGEWISWYEQVAPLQFAQGDVLADVDTPTAMALADLDADGDLDVVTRGDFGGGALGWAENTGAGAFDPWVQLLIGDGPTLAAVADIDGDGDVDLVTALRNTDVLVVLPNLGGGVFGAAQTLASGPYSQVPVPADVDADGDVDLLVGTGIVTVELHWLLNDGAGTFTPGAWTDVGSAYVDAALAYGDIDGDGLGDVVVTDYSGDQLRWFAGLGAADFGTGSDFAVGNDTPEHLALADLDGDADLDVGFRSGTTSDGVLLWCENLGAGGFAAPLEAVDDTAEPIAFATGDLDGDGLVELVVLTDGPDDIEGKTVAHRNLGGGLFDAPIEISGDLREPSSVVGVDLDQDGDEDLLVADRETGAALWFANQGGSFGDATFITAGLDAHEAVPTDLDGDGDLDLVVPTTTTGIHRVEALGGGAFAAPTPLFEGLNSTRLVAGDVDADGDQDLVSTSGWPSGSLTWAENLGAGTFGAPLAFDGAESVYRMSLGDVDGDADLDLVGPRYFDDNIGVWTFAGGFSTYTIVSPVIDGLSETRFADLDGDGDLDIAFNAYSYNPYIAVAGQVGWIENLGGGVFAMGVNLVAAPVYYTDYLDAADLDGDGDVDLLYTETYDERVSWSENLGAGAWAAPEVIGTDLVYGGALDAFDADGDTCLDVVAVGSVSGMVAWYRNDACPLPILETGDTGAPEDTGEPTDTDTDTHVDTDTDANGDTDTGSPPDPDNEQVDPASRADDGGGPCSCGVGGPRGSWLPALALLLVARRRRADCDR